MGAVGPVLSGGEMARKFNVMMIATENAGLAKTGGLGDVVAGLSRALAVAGHHVTVFMPFFKQVENCELPLQPINGKVEATLGGKTIQGELFRYRQDGVETVLLKNEDLFGRDGIYVDPKTGADFPDNDARFGFFAKAALEYAKSQGKAPDILHAHEWHGGLAVALAHFENAPVLSSTSTIFTIHNLSYQGLFDPEKLSYFGLPEESFQIDGVEYHGNLSLLKAGIAYADAVTTVSDKYAQEIQTPEFGYGMEGMLLSRGQNLTGILNGVDYGEWNPETDKWIAANYSALDLTGKKTCKEDLIRRVGLPEERNKGPVFGMITRMVEQKGLDLVIPIVQDIIAHGGSLVVLGTGDPKIEADYKALQEQHPEHVAVQIRFDEPMAHRIEAGADFFLMPSRFEPCGLNQMFSLRYGTVPIVRATGGLDDSVKEYIAKSGRGNGIKFADPEPEALLRAIVKGLDIYGRERRWDRIRTNAMTSDFSWTTRARKYITLYGKLIRAKKAQGKN
jgi:starch synthase